MPRPVTPAHKGPSRGEFLIPHPQQAGSSDDECDAAVDQAGGAAMFSFGDDGTINMDAADAAHGKAAEGACGSASGKATPARAATPRKVDVIRASFAQHLELANLVRDLKTMILVDFETQLTSAREQFGQYKELLERQSSMMEAFLQHASLIPDGFHSKMSAIPMGGKLGVSDAKSDVPQIIHYEHDLSQLPTYHVHEGDLDYDKDSDVMPRGTVQKSQEPEKKKASLRGVSQTASGLVRTFTQRQSQAATQSEAVEQYVRGRVAHNSHEEDLCVPDYKVENFYYETGIAQAVAKSEHFQNFTLFVIIVNAIYIGIDADRNNSDSISEAAVPFQVCEYWFFAFFSLEWITRFAAFEYKCDCIRDMWFKFDTALVFMMVFENTFLPIIMDGAGIPIPTSMIKLVRLLRLARMARLMRALPELVAMIKGVRMSLRAVGSALLLLVILVYVFAIIVFVLLRDRVHELEDSNGKLYAKTYFGTLSLTMWTLLVDGAFMESYGALSRKLLDSDQWLVFFALIAFVLASALTVMNMLIGVLCEVVTGVAASEKEDADIRLVKETLLLMLLELDVTGDGKISREEMQGVMGNEMALKVLKSMEVNATYLMDHVQMSFEDSMDGNLAISEILDLILMLRGDRQPTVKDMLHGQNFMRWKLTTILRQHEILLSSLIKSHHISNLGSAKPT